MPMTFLGYRLKAVPAEILEQFLKKLGEHAEEERPYDSSLQSVLTWFKDQCDTFDTAVKTRQLDIDNAAAIELSPHHQEIERRLVESRQTISGLQSERDSATGAWRTAIKEIDKLNCDIKRLSEASEWLNGELQRICAEEDIMPSAIRAVQRAKVVWAKRAGGVDSEDVSRWRMPPSVVPRGDEGVRGSPPGPVAYNIAALERADLEHFGCKSEECPVARMGSEPPEFIPLGKEPDMFLKCVLEGEYRGRCYRFVSPLYGPDENGVTYELGWRLIAEDKA